MDYTKYNRVLTSRGYAIKKSSLVEAYQQRIRQQLTVAPISNPKFNMTGPPFAVYAESSTRFYLPRHWARREFGMEEADAMPEGIDLPTTATFTGKPFDYQEKILDTFFSANSNGLICVPCGKGKTFMALAIASRIGKRFLIVVDKEFLLNQWKGEINAFFPGLRVGILQGNRCEVDTDAYDCTICMMQTLVQRKFSSDIFKTYGFTIFDECHHLGACNFSQSLLKVQTKCMLGLSATPTRDDGLSKVFHWYLGEPVYWEKTRESDPTVQVRILRFDSKDNAYLEPPLDYKDDVIMARLLTQIVECRTRNEMIVKEIKELGSNHSRRILVLSERKGHLEQIEKMLASSGLSMSYYIGGMKEEVRESGAKSARVLLATYAMASEAMNIRSLNTVILATPRKKVEQSVGRILRERPSERKVVPMILDIHDPHGVYQGQYHTRRRFYKSCGYSFQIRCYNDSGLIEESSEDDTGSDTDTESKPVECGFID